MRLLFGLGIFLVLVFPIQVMAHQLSPLTVKIIRCESHWKHEARNKSGAYGIAQFKKKTFEWLKKKAHQPELKWSSPYDQVLLLDWAVRHHYGHLWACYKKVRQ